MNVLVVNCGSSSLKYAVLDAVSGEERASGLAQRLGGVDGSLKAHVAGGAADGGGPERGESTVVTPLPGAGHDEALRAALDGLRTAGLLPTLGGVGHRVVHGGDRFAGSVRITPEVIAQIEACTPLGPLHNPSNLLGIRLTQQLLPGLPQVAVFDTAFHQTMPARAYTYPVPTAWREAHGVRRYGFHGSSHRFVSRRALAMLDLGPEEGALVTAHLGNGCSAAAVLNGRSVDTTMGLTPLEGLVMGTRSGSVDPAIIGHVARASGQAPEAVLDALNKGSGLLGLSGLTNDMRALEAAAAEGHAGARLAIEVFVYTLAKAIAALIVPLGRLDALVFTGGIGENAADIRARTVALLEFTGLRLDPGANAETVRGRAGRITRGPGPAALVIPTNEELVIAQDTAALVAAAP